MIRGFSSGPATMNIYIFFKENIDFFINEGKEDRLKLK